MVHILLAKASATGENPKYAAGEIHGVMIYCLTADGASPDYDSLRKAMADEDWEDVKFVKQGRVGDGNFAKSKPDDPNRLAYESAKRDGLAFVVYDVADEPKLSS